MLAISKLKHLQQLDILGNRNVTLPTIQVIMGRKAVKLERQGRKLEDFFALRYSYFDYFMLCIYRI